MAGSSLRPATFQISSEKESEKVFCFPVFLKEKLIMQCCLYSSPIGEIILAADAGALVGLWFVGQRYSCAGLNAAEPETDESGLLSAVCRWLDGYFAGEVSAINFPLAPRGTAFQKRVWRELLSIPYGETISYGELAKRAGCASARAVGNAVGHNPISILIPCHRVVGSNGKLTGYAGGVEKKRFLLALEGTVAGD